MEHVNLPPQRISLPNIIKAVSEKRAEQNNDRLEPHMLFLSHDVSRRMSEQLKKENSDIHMFVHQACIEYLNKIDNEVSATQRWIDFSEQQLTASGSFIGWSHNESDEDRIIRLDKNGQEEGE